MTHGTFLVNEKWMTHQEEIQ